MARRVCAPAFVLASLVASVPAVALADSPTGDTGSPSSVSPSPNEAAMQRTAAERRSGVVIGLASGVAFAGASGYPNDPKVIGNPDFYSESPLLVGTSGSLFVMGALTDYLSFGPMIHSARMETEKWRSTGFAVGFRLDVFPLYRLVPRLADLAVYGMMGVGATELQAKGPYPSADGTQSFLGGGVHHEWRFFRMLGGHVSGGPFVEYDAIFSSSAERHLLSLGFRVAWYGGSVTADGR